MKQKILLAGKTLVNGFLALTFYCLPLSAIAQNLNDSILLAQEKAIKNSPYTNAKGFSVPKFQTDFRRDGYPQLISNFLFNKIPLHDTLWVVESFDFVCPTCESYSSEILRHCWCCAEGCVKLHQQQNFISHVDALEIPNCHSRYYKTEQMNTYMYKDKNTSLLL